MACGGLLIWAGTESSIRTPVVTVVVFEKVVLVALILSQAGKPSFKKLLPAAAMDSLMLVVLVIGILDV